MAYTLPTINVTLKTQYTPEQTRRVLKIEQAEYIEAFVEQARYANPSFEGAGLQTGRTTFYFKGYESHVALVKFAELHADGWTLDTTAICLVPTTDKDGRLMPIEFTAICPDHVFDTYRVNLAQRAEAQYLKEITQHNKGAVRIKERAEFIEAEYARLEEERKAELRAEIERKYDAAKHGSNIVINAD